MEFHLMANLGWWLTLIWDVPPSCPAAQPLLPNSHQPKQNRADSRRVKIEVNPTQVGQEIGHPVQPQCIMDVSSTVLSNITLQAG